MKAAIDRQINVTVRRGAGQRHEFSRAELNQIDQDFSAIVTNAVNEVFNGN